MPALPAIREPVLADLIGELRYAPPATLRRHIERAEGLAGDLDPAQRYPEEWVVYRVTGYRPESVLSREALGGALLADLSAFIETLCDHAALREDELPEGSKSLTELGDAWSVSTPTLTRYRRQGLVARRVRSAAGRTRLAFTPEAIRAFEARRGEGLARAGSFARHDAETTRAIVDRALEIHAGRGGTVARVARTVAAESGLPAETVRQLLLRTPGVADRIGHRGPPTARERRFIDRALGIGAEPEEIARRLDRPVAAVRRAGLLERASRLRAWAKELAEPPAWVIEPGADRVLGTHAARAGLGGCGPGELADLVRTLADTAPTPAAIEHERARALRFLLARARGATARLSASSPSATTIDAIETDLRWAALLKIELVRDELGLVGRTLREQQPGLDDWPASERALLVLAAISAVGHAVDRFSPPAPPAIGQQTGRSGVGHRLAGPAGIAIARVVATWGRARAGAAVTAGGASRRILSGHTVPDWTRTMAPWSDALFPPPRIWALLDRETTAEVSGAAGSGARLEAAVSDLLRRRFGLGGFVPHSSGELAAALGLPRMHAATRERAAWRSVRRAARTIGA